MEKHNKKKKQTNKYERKKIIFIELNYKLNVTLFYKFI